MITVITGTPGAGKTALAVDLLQREYADRPLYVDNLNGLLLEHFEDIPESGVSVRIAGVPMEIVQTQDRAVKFVRIHRPSLTQALAPSVTIPGS